MFRKDHKYRTSSAPAALQGQQVFPTGFPWATMPKSCAVHQDIQYREGVLHIPIRALPDVTRGALPGVTRGALPGITKGALLYVYPHL